MHQRSYILTIILHDVWWSQAFVEIVITHPSAIYGLISTRRQNIYCVPQHSYIHSLSLCVFVGPMNPVSLSRLGGLAALSRNWGHAGQEAAPC